MNIELHIERLILDGVDIVSGERHLLQAAVEAELARLLGSGDIAPQLARGGAHPRVSADAMRMANKGGPTSLGRQIAASVFSAIGNTGSRVNEH